LPSRSEKEKAAAILHALRERYPDAHCALNHRSPWQLLCATIMAAQCTDERVNLTTPTLFARYPGPEAMAGANQEELEEIIKSTGFFRNKAKSLVAASQEIVAIHGGEVPRTMDELVALPGVGRKTANVILGEYYEGCGVVVDTHVRRLSQRLGWTKSDDPDKIEQDLMALHPRAKWTNISHTLTFHGRDLCDAKKPRCPECPALALCPTGSGTGPAPKKQASKKA
jgi:endonuclease III